MSVKEIQEPLSAGLLNRKKNRLTNNEEILSPNKLHKNSGDDDSYSDFDEEIFVKEDFNANPVEINPNNNNYMNRKNFSKILESSRDLHSLL